MLGIGGKFASSKGMVAMPSLSGLTRLQAIAAIQASGLRLGNAAVSNTSNQSQDQAVASQDIAAGSLIDYETPVSFLYFNYVAPPVPQGPTVINSSSTGCIESERYIISNNCNSSTKIGTTTYGFRRHSVTTLFYSDGSTSSSTTSCTDSSRTETQTVYNCDGSLDCNSFSRRYSDTRTTSQCSSGYGIFNIGEYNSGCGKSDSVTFSFCTTNPNAANCTSCASSQNYTVSNSGCASGTAWRTLCTHPSGCSPSQSDVYGGCIPVPAPQPVCGTSCTPWYRSSCSNGQRFVTRRCSDCNGNNEYRETYYESC